MLVLIAVGLVLAFVLPLVLAVTVVALAAAAADADAATGDDADEAAAAAAADELTEDDATEGGAVDAEATEEWPPDTAAECATLEERCLLPASRAVRRFDMVISWCLHCSDAEASNMDGTQMQMQMRMRWNGKR